MEVTPDTAASWIALFNTDNRKVRSTIVNKYAKLMTEGEWILSDQCISFDVTNKLLNGQHRLMAVVKSGVTIKAMVARNMPSETFKYMDRGTLRSNADIHGMSKCFSSFIHGLVRHLGGRNCLNFTEIENARFFVVDRDAALTHGNIEPCYLETLVGWMNNGTNAKIVTSGSSRFAAAFCCAYYGDRNYIIDLMRRLIQADRSQDALRDLPPRGYHFMRLIKDKAVGHWDGTLILNKALDLFNPERKHLKTVRDAPEEVLIAARAWAKEVIGGKS